MSQSTEVFTLSTPEGRSIFLFLVGMISAVTGLIFQSTARAVAESTGSSGPLLFSYGVLLSGLILLLGGLGLGLTTNVDRKVED